MIISSNVGKSFRRVEDLRFLKGQGTYIDDINIKNQAYAVFLRSPHAHAIISAIDVKAASQAPGVKLIVTGRDWVAENYGPIPCKSAVNTFINGSSMKQPPRHCLAINRVRFVGEIIAMIIAKTRPLAAAAAELIDITFEELEAVIDPTDAIKPGAPQLWDEIPRNLCLDFELGDKEKIDAIFSSAHFLITRKIKNNRLTGVPIEPRGAIAQYDTKTNRLSLWNTSQNIHANRDAYAVNILNLKRENIHHVAPDVGGGFGVKNGIYPEPALIAHAAKKLNCPIKWIADRSESFLSDTHGRDQVSTVSLALGKEGKFLGLRTETIGNLGAYCGTVGPFTPTGGSARTQGGPYNFDALYYFSQAVFTNTGVLDPYRGAGRPEASFQIERIIEEASREFNFDPIELRRNNLIETSLLPLKNMMGLDIDCGDFLEVFNQTLFMTDRSGFSVRVANAAKRGQLLGFSISPYLECTGGGPKEYASVNFRNDGKVELSVGSHSTGMGHETSFAQLLSGYLGLMLKDIEFYQGDTERSPIGGGHGGSRGMEVGGSAVHEAASAIIKKGSLLAADILDADENCIKFSDGIFSVAGTNLSVTIKEVIALSLDPEKLSENFYPGYLNTGTVFEREIISIPNGCHACEVEVDPETGTIKVVNYWAVDDFGTIINSLLTDGQVMGGVTQGIGQVLLEEAVYDQTGQLITGSLIDYALPRAQDIPNMNINYFQEKPTKKNPLGVKGAGEAGCVAAPQVIFNAVVDALKSFDTQNLDMPLTSEKIWRTIQNTNKTNE